MGEDWVVFCTTNEARNSPEIKPNSSPNSSPRVPPESEKFVAAISLWETSGVTVCALECPTKCLRALAPGSGASKVSRECPWSVPKVSWTLQCPGPKGPRRHFVGHSLGHSLNTPVFGDTVRDTVRDTPWDTPWGHFGPEGPKRLLWGDRRASQCLTSANLHSQEYRQSNSHFWNFIVMASAKENNVFGPFSPPPPSPTPHKNNIYIYA